MSSSSSPRTSTVVPTRSSFTSPPFAALSSALGNVIIRSATATPLVGGLSGELSTLHVVLDNGPQLPQSPLTLVLKTTRDGADAEASAASLGTAREALFYLHLAPELSRVLPPGSLARCHYASGDMKRGRKALLLEKIVGGTDSGLVFGPSSPLNWTRADDVLAAAALASPEAAAASAFRLAARMHGLFWRDAARLLDGGGGPSDWLRGAAWRRRRPRPREEADDADAVDDYGKAAFEASQARVVSAWAKALAAAAEGGEGAGDVAGAGADAVRWAEEFPHLTRCMSASLGRVSWESFRASCVDERTPFTLVHGDFHPGNLVLLLPPGPAFSDDSTPAPSLPRTVMLDFEAVGVGSGPQDLGQYVISHMDPGVRRGCEERLLRAYHAELLATADAAGRGAEARADLPTYEACAREYAAGGAERWVWLLALLSGLCPAPMLRFWGAQMERFFLDHGVDAEGIGQPRA
jgi:hypothetical protein